MKDGVILRVSKPARMGIDDASLYPLQPCLPRGLRSALLRKASVLRNWLLRKWDARQPRSAFSRLVAHRRRVQGQRVATINDAVTIAAVFRAWSAAIQPVVTPM